MQANMKAFLISIFLSQSTAFTFNNVMNENSYRKNINRVDIRGSTSLFVSTLPGKNENMVEFNEDEEITKTEKSVSLSREIDYLESKETKSYLDDGFIFGLEGSGIERPKGKVSQVVVEGDTTETQPYQVAMVLSTFIFHLSLIGINSVELVNLNGGNAVETIAQIFAILATSWVAADFGSAVLHWSVDNYGNGRTPIMGNIIAAFQGHHAAPWTITERGFCNNVYKLCVPFGIPTMTLINILSGPSATIFFAFFCMAEILSQEFHKWSHTTKKEVPEWVNTLQDIGLTMSRTQHANHHKGAYEGNYCIISGICNEALDNSGFFRRLEHIVYNINGVESNAWKLDPKLRERTLNGEYRL